MSDVGVTIAKKTIPITIGDTKLPNIIPNLNQILFKVVKNFEFNNPKTKKTKAIIMDQILIFSFFNSGNNEIIKKTKKNTVPKFLFVGILISFINLLSFNIL